MAPAAPTKHLNRIIILIKLFLIKVIRIIGAILCQVRIIRAWNHLDDWITWGNQKWKGAAPILIERAKRIMELIINKEFEELRLKMSTEEKIIIKEAKAWAIKYLIAVSEE